MNKKISFLSLVLLIIASIDNIRNLPAAALFGTTLPFFFILASLLFLFPTALVAAQLAASFPEKGGIYEWVGAAFSKKWAMVAVWLQWINTMVWYPTMLSFVAATFAYLIDPTLATHKPFLIISILVIFWGLTLVNLLGFHMVAFLNNLCAVFGTILPMLLLIALGVLFFMRGEEIQIRFTSTNWLPALSDSTSWVSLIAIMASFLGMELSGVHVNDIRNPQKNFPRAVFIAAFFILLSMIFGSLTIAWVLPEQEIVLTSGVMQTFERFGLGAWGWTLMLLIGVGSTGMMINWLISPAKGLLHAAEFGFLPPFFTRKNKHGVASRILVTQALCVSGVCMVYLFQPSVNGFYWFLTALSTELYMIMYILMFLAALALYYKKRYASHVFRIPFGAIGLWITALLGLTGALLTIFVSFIPPENIDTGGSSRYLTLITVGNLITLTPVFLFFTYKKWTKSR